jgi:hypothetical protein
MSNLRTDNGQVGTSLAEFAIIIRKTRWLFFVFVAILLVKAPPLIAGTNFSAEIKPLPDWVVSKMKRYSWRKGCPVPLDHLAYIYLKHWNNEGKIQFGRLVIHKKVANDIVEVFKLMFGTKFPISKLKLIDDFQGSDVDSMAANNTSAFNCRNVTGKDNVYSRHSYGLAIDINPLVNPYINHELVYPPKGRIYANRNLKQKGMIRKGDIIYREFIKRGWTWGGDWNSVKDYQHFQKKIK